MAGVNDNVERLSRGKIVVDVFRQLEIQIPILVVVRDAEALHVVTLRPIPLVGAVSAVVVDEKLLSGLCEKVKERAAIRFLSCVDFLAWMSGKLVSVHEHVFDSEFVTFAQRYDAFDIGTIINKRVSFCSSDEGGSRHFALVLVAWAKCGRGAFYSFSGALPHAGDSWL